MTTTENIITITFNDADAECIEAAYYQIEDGWVTFKSADHKAVAGYPTLRVTSIKGEKVTQPSTRKEVIDEMTKIVEFSMTQHQNSLAKLGDVENVPLSRLIAGILFQRGYHPFPSQDKVTASA